jgi:hypothetical protein
MSIFAFEIIVVILINSHQACPHLVEKTTLESLGVNVRPHVTCRAVLDNHLSSTNLVLNHEVPVVDVLGALGALGAREPPVQCHQDGRLVVLHKNILLNLETLCLDEI